MADSYSSLSPDWLLFVDWCAAAGFNPDAATAEHLGDFAAATSGSDATKRRRTDRIRAHLRAHGLPDPMPPEPPDRSDLIAAAGEVLAATVVDGWPDGLRGRRDAAIVALRAHAGMSRRQIRELAPADIAVRLGRVRIAGTALDQAAHPGPCPACAISRWVRLLTDAKRHGWAYVRNRLAVHGANRADTQVDHDCHRLVLPGWQSAASLLPPIDHRGLVEDELSLSTRSLSAVSLTIPPEPIVSELPRHPYRPDATSEPWDRVKQAAELATLDPVFDRLERDIAEADRRIQDLLDEQDALRKR